MTSSCSISQGGFRRFETPCDNHHSYQSTAEAEVPSCISKPLSHKISDPAGTLARTVESHELTLRSHPLHTLQYFSLAVYEAIPKQWPFSVMSTLLLTTVVMVSLGIHFCGKSGSTDDIESNTVPNLCQWLEASMLETLFWIGCGVLSTIGFGSGVQTGALFLFPHVCRLALAWSKEQQQHQQDGTSHAPSLVSLLWSVAIPGFWSGGGSAAGELVPFLLARVIRQSGKDPFDLLNVEISSATRSFDRDEITSSQSTVGSQDSFSSSESLSGQEINEESSGWTPRLLLSNTRVAMESQLSSNTFWKIFTLAVVPNALFDLAGLICGASSDVTWWQFFSATWLAKALVRTPAQTCGLALAVVAIASPSSLANGGVDNLARQNLTRAAAAASSSTTTGVSDFFEQWGRMALAEFVGDDEFLLEKASVETVAARETAALSIVFVVIKAMWSLMTVAMLMFFIMSTIEQVAQHHVRNKKIVDRPSSDADASSTMTKKRV